MANQIILHAQSFNWKDLVEQFPGNSKMKKKIYFQAELASLENGDAAFHIIAYPAWREDACWELGYKVNAAQTKPGNPQKFNEPLGFANNELRLSLSKKKKKNKKVNKDKKKSREFQELFEKVAGDPKLAAVAVFHCKTHISENPHLEYEITLEAGTASATTWTNPSPPGSPSS